MQQPEISIHPLIGRLRKERPTMTKPREKTREELQAEIEDGKKKIRQLENREKIIKQKLSVEERKARNHRLCKRGGFMESLVPELIAMPDEDAQTFFRLALTSEPAQEFLKNEPRKRQAENPLGTKGALIHPYGRVRSAEGLSPHREISPRSDMAALPQQGAAPLAPLRGYPCTPTKTVHPPLASVPFLRVLLSYPGGDTHSHLPLEHRHCEPRKRQISRCRRLPKRRKADKRMGRNDP